MSLEQNNLGLRLRQRSQALDSKMHYSPKKIAAWVKALPMANVGEVARRVYETLIEANSTLMEPQERYNVHEVLQPTVAYLTDYLKKHYTGHAVSLNDKQRKIASLAQALQVEMATGYKTIITDLVESRDKKAVAKLLVPSVYQALYYFHKVLVRCYQLYTQAPPSVWKEIHVLYQFIYTNRMHAEAVVKPEAGTINTVEKLYKYMVMTSLSNPYQLRQKDIEHMVAGLEHLIEHCDILPVCDESCHFAVMFGTDKPPLHTNLLKEISSGVCGVDLAESVSVLQDALKLNTAIDSSVASQLLSTLGKPLVRHLLRAWGNMTTRAFSRTACSGELEAAIGLSATHYMLSGEADEIVLKSTEPGDNLSEATILGDDGKATEFDHKWKKSDDEDGDLWQRVFKGGQPLGTSNQQTQQQKRILSVAKNLDKQAPKYKSIFAELVNMSPGGYCLSLTKDVPAQTHTGEIIGVAEKDSISDDFHWNIGTIRWMKRISSQSLKIGVQLIAPHAFPVQSKLKSTTNSATKTQRCLMLPALKGIGQPATLITNPLPYKVKDKIEIEEGDQVYEARLTKLIASTPAYKQFQFERLADLPRKAHSTSPDKKQDDNDNFSGVWEII